MNSPARPALSATLRAALLMMGAMLCFSAMAIAARELAGRHDTFEIMAARSAVGLALVLAWAVGAGRLAEISLAHFGAQLLRNGVHFVGQNLWFWALTLIPLSQLFALEFTAPIWVILLAPLALGERLTARRLVAAAVGFAGILIVTRPFGALPGPGVLAAAGSAVFFALTSILTKRLTAQESLTAILFWLALVQLVLGLACALWDGAVRWPDAQTLPWLIVIGLAGILAHLTLTAALRLAPASFVVPLDFVRLPLIALVGAAVYAEPLDPMVLAGGLVIFLGVWINLRAEMAPEGIREENDPARR